MVTHFHFTTWPDKGCPQLADGHTNTRVMLNFIQTVRSHQPREIDAPILVHCRYQYDLFAIHLFIFAIKIIVPIFVWVYFERFTAAVPTGRCTNRPMYQQLSELVYFNLIVSANYFCKKQWDIHNQLKIRPLYQQ